MAAGSVDRAATQTISWVERIMGDGVLDERPANIAPLNSVPCSASNLSSSGTSASVLKRAWRKFRCMRGYVFNLYTMVQRKSATEDRTVPTDLGGRTAALTYSSLG